MQAVSGEVITPTITTHINNPIPTQNDILAARQRLLGSVRHGPKTGLQKIPVSMSQSEAMREHQFYTPPKCYELEPVYYRRVSGGDERLGYVLGENNKHFTIYVMKENHLPETVKSVSYYDPENKGDNAKLNDPKGPHNSNGIFRRCGMGLLMQRLEAMLATMERLAPLVEDLEIACGKK